MNKFFKVFTIILNYNSKDTIKDCLFSVFKSDYPNYEVVVADNDSRDGSLELAKTLFPRAHFIKNEKNLGFAAGVNVGIRFALERFADYVFLLNSDAFIERKTISKLIKTAESMKKAGILSPIIYNSEKEGVWFSGGRIKWFSMKAAHSQNDSKTNPYSISYVSGCAMLVKKEVFREVGLFDEDYFLYYEDADFCRRAKKKGFECLVVPEARTYHAEKSESDKKSKTYWLVFSALIFFKKNAPLALKLWLFIYLAARKIKNKMDIASRKNELAKIVQKAYNDFKIWNSR